jgi:hypothetical protein
MAALVLSNLAGLTVAYNGVQFGGADSDYKSTPPTYSFRGTFVYDDSRRAVKMTRYTLEVHCIFNETAEGSMAANAEDLRNFLMAPGKSLTIEGLGTGFDRLNGGLTAIQDDVDYGPRPLDFQWNPLGQIAWEMYWQVEFNVSECANPRRNELAFAAFNFDTSWANDFEGICTRTISGYVEIAMKRSGRNGKVPKHVVDEVRDQIEVIVPIGFRRTSNIWRENYAKNRLDFSVTDEALPGDFLPVGCIAADGDISYDSAGPGFNEASVTLSMSVRTAPDAPRGLAGNLFMTAAITKQAAMQTINNKGTVIPSRISFRAGKFDRARDTSFSMSWHLTKCINEMMAAAEIWEPVPIDGNFNNKNPANFGNYAVWRSSISHLWGNRGIRSEGVLGLRSLASEAVIIDLCDNTTYATIGGSTSQTPVTAGKPNKLFTCPDVPEDGGWIKHDLRIRVLRKDEQTWHKKAVSYLPSPGETTAGSGDGLEGSVPLGGAAYTQSVSDEHDVEHHGLPTVHILVQFRGLRVKRKPTMPELKTIAGLPVTLVEQEIDGPRLAFDILTCPAWFIRGYRVYRVNGYVPEVKPVESKTSCGASGAVSPIDA